MISVIVPVLNEAEGIVRFLQPLQKYREENVEIIIVDGGSYDSTVELAKPLSDIVCASEKGRAKQMNFGAKLAQGDVLIFLHADTVLPENFYAIIQNALTNEDKCWGRFDVNLTGSSLSLRLVEYFMNRRSRLTGIATGDQAIFVDSRVFQQVCGFEDIPLMEDVALSKTLKAKSAPICLNEKVITSSRRWEKFGIWRTVLLMWQLRLAYYFGMDPQRLAAKYD